MIGILDLDEDCLSTDKDIYNIWIRSEGGVDTENHGAPTNHALTDAHACRIMNTTMFSTCFCWSIYLSQLYATVKNNFFFTLFICR